MIAHFSTPQLFLSLTSGKPINGEVCEDNIPLVEDRAAALMVHVAVHQGMGPHEVQHPVRQLPRARQK